MALTAAATATLSALLLWLLQHRRQQLQKPSHLRLVSSPAPFANAAAVSAAAAAAAAAVAAAGNVADAA